MGIKLAVDQFCRLMLSVIDMTGGAFGNEASAEAFHATPAAPDCGGTFCRSHGIRARVSCNP
jgi:hypothetical protein